MTSKYFSIGFVLSAILIAALAGCNGGSAGSSAPASITQENEWVSFTRTVSPEVGVNDAFTVKIEVVAKRALELLAASDTLPKGLVLVSGSPTSFMANAEPTQTLSFEYRVKATRQGKFDLTGATKARPPGIESLALDLTSTITAK